MTTTIELPKNGFRAVVQYKEQPVYFFRYDGEDTEDDTIVCQEVTVMLKNAAYETMVATLIEVKYSIDAQLALLYNYQADSEQYASQMQTYQQWRTYCKESAREWFGIE